MCLLTGWHHLSKPGGESHRAYIVYSLYLWPRCIRASLDIAGAGSTGIHLSGGRDIGEMMLENSAFSTEQELPRCQVDNAPLRLTSGIFT